MERKAIACFFAVDFDQMDYLEKTLLEYDIGNYAIAFECEDSKGEPKPHFHFFFYGTEQIYSALSKRIADKYKLRKNQKGGKINYGKVKNIRDIEKMLAYTVKHGCIRTNFPEEELKTAIEQAFIKVKQVDRLKDMCEWLDLLEEDLLAPQHIVLAQSEFCSKSKTIYADEIIKKNIILYCLENDLRISRPSITSYHIYYITHTNRFTNSGERVNHIFNYVK